VRLQSDIVEIRRPATVTDVRAPRAPKTPTYALLAQAALDLAKANEHGLARKTAADALDLSRAALDCESADRLGVAHVVMMIGDAYLRLSEMHSARECFELATGLFDFAGALGDAAHARIGLGTALRELCDPRARAVVEDAGEIFEELGDQAAVLQIDRVLREMQADFEECPRSFHSSIGILRVASVRS
jgi:hypothetical protein